MKSKFVLAVIACLVVTADAQEPWGGESQRSRVGVYALEGLGALGGCAGCLCVPVGAAYACGLDVLSGDIGEGMLWGFLLVASALPMPAAVGFGAAKAGDGLGESGSTGSAIGGAYVGAVVGVGLYYGLSAIALASSGLMDRPSWLPGALTSAGVVGVLAIPVGAVVGYNRGAPRETGPFGSRYRERLQLPSVALTSAELPDHSIEHGVKVQLAGLRF